MVVLELALDIGLAAGTWSQVGCVQCVLGAPSLGDAAANAACNVDAALLQRYTQRYEPIGWAQACPNVGEQGLGSQLDAA